MAAIKIVITIARILLRSLEKSIPIPKIENAPTAKIRRIILSIMNPNIFNVTKETETNNSAQTKKKIANINIKPPALPNLNPNNIYENIKPTLTRCSQIDGGTNVPTYWNH
jgi:hypothetical protein